LNELVSDETIPCNRHHPESLGLTAFNTDKLRSQARKKAWYDAPDDPKTYNPWSKGKRASAQHQRHVGEQLETNHSQSCLPDDSPVNEHNALGNTEFGGPKHAPTEPILNHEHGSGASGPEGIMNGDGKETYSGNTSFPSARSSDQIAGGTTSSSKPLKGNSRKRFMDKLLHRKSEDVEMADLERGASRSSKSKTKKHFTLKGQLKATLFNSWLNVLLIAAPLGIILNYVHVNPIAVFTINFIAIIPLAAMLSYATEELALRVGETLGGLLNASFGNAVELIVSIIALLKNQILIVQTSLIGSILSNLLLVMGMCFFFGGLKRSEQYFNITVAQTAASMLALAVGSIIIPGAFQSFSGGLSSMVQKTEKPLLIFYSWYKAHS
jgi:Ca2+:H+ antiporter